MGTTPRTRPALGGPALSAWCVAAAFGTYFCMYGFRKPFTAATFSGVDPVEGFGFKTVLVTAQVLGYTVSKFVGIKVVAELPPHRRALGILALVGIAQVALLLFGLVPPPYNAACLFLNGLPLGMVFGLVVGFLEGRRTTEALAAGLCASFILADGVTKTVGRRLLDAGVPDVWMPFAAGAVYAAPLLVFVWMLTRIPPPTAADHASRGERHPMTAADRRGFVRRYAAGLVPLLAAYLLVTILRSIRADFAPEIWAGLGGTPDPGVYSRTEMVVASGVILANGLAVFVADNRRAFHTAMATAAAGLGLVVAAAAARSAGAVGGFAFMVLVGLGLYLPYVAVHTTVFERLIAMTRARGTIGYLLTLADAFGYLGFAAVMLAKEAAAVGASGFLDFFTTACLVGGGAGAVLLAASWAALSHPGVARGKTAASPSD